MHQRCSRATAALLASRHRPRRPPATSSPSGSDAGNCLSTPCATFGRAYSQAAAGDVIVVGPGVYPARRRCRTAARRPLTFQGEPGNEVRQLHNHASNVTFDGLDVDAGGATPTGAAFESHAAPNVTFKNGRIGNVDRREGRAAGRLEQHGLDERRDRQRRPSTTSSRRATASTTSASTRCARADGPQLDVPRLRDDGHDDHARRSGGASPPLRRRDAREQRLRALRPTAATRAGTTTAFLVARRDGPARRTRGSSTTRSRTRSAASRPPRSAAPAACGRTTSAAAGTACRG